jgi:hypothetical protein
VVGTFIGFPVINPMVDVVVDVVTSLNTRPLGRLPDITVNLVVPVPVTENGISTAVLSVTVPKNPARVNHFGAAIFIT